MSFDLSDYPIRDILNAAKENIADEFYKVTIENVKYPVLIRCNEKSLIMYIYCRKDQINKENPIEKEIIDYNEIKKEEVGDRFFEIYGYELNVDFLNRENYFFHPILDYLFRGHNYEFSQLNKKTNQFLKSLIGKLDLITLIDDSVRYETLENPESDFEKKLRNFIYKKCIEEFDNNNELQDKLVEIYEKRNWKELEKEKRMEKVREREHKIQEFNDNLKTYERKNLKDYNIK